MHYIKVFHRKSVMTTEEEKRMSYDMCVISERKILSFLSFCVFISIGNKKGVIKNINSSINSFLSTYFSLFCYINLDNCSDGGAKTIITVCMPFVWY